MSTSSILPAAGEPLTYCFTFGVYNQTSPWNDRRQLTWPELAALLTRHQIGTKEGAGIVPATFTGTKRHKNDAQRIDVGFLDSDSGATLEAIRDAVARCGFAAIVSSTYSHLATRTRVKRGNWDRFRLAANDPDLAPSTFLLAKGYLPHVAEGAAVVEETDEYIVLEHAPCPKFRIAIPLQRPWLAASFDDQRAANAAWCERIEALSAALHLDHDQACTDTSRLFYLPRRPEYGPPPETAVIEGEPCDLFALPAAEHSSRLDGGGGGRDVGGRRQPKPRAAKPEFKDPETGLVVDLVKWGRRYGKRFQIVTALQARCPEVFAPRPNQGTKRHLRCVNEEAHTRAGADAATFVVNASESLSNGFVHHCRHAHCDGLDRLAFLQQMLEQRWLSVPDLSVPEFLFDGTSPEAAEDGPTGCRKPQWLEIGSDAEIASRVAKDLARRLGPVVHDEGEFWQHNRRHWQAIPSEELWQAVLVYDGAGFVSPEGDQSNVKLGAGRVESVLICMKPLVSRRRYFADAPSGINCSSGFITFLSDGTASLAPHSPEHRQQHVIAGHWPCKFSDSVKKSSLLHRLLHGCFQDDQDKRAKIDLLAEVAGIAAVGHATRIVQPKTLVCFGKLAENGKSQVLAMFRSLLPTSAVSAIPPARFDDRTFVCHLVGKLLNATDELGSAKDIVSAIFKQVITGDPVTARDVYRRAFEFEPRAQHVFATNTLPTFKDGMDRGVRRRRLVLTFNRVIPVEERLDRIGQRIGEEEADLLLDWAVRGAARVIAAQAFVTPASSDEALRDWMYSSDSVLAWLESNEVEFKQNGKAAEIKGSVAYSKFMRWACTEGFGQDQVPAVNGFSQRVLAAGKGVTKKRTKEGPQFIGLCCTGRGMNGFPGAWRR